VLADPGTAPLVAAAMRAEGLEPAMLVLRWRREWPSAPATPGPIVTATPVVTAPRPPMTAGPEPVVTAEPEPTVTAVPGPVVTAGPQPTVTAVPPGPPVSAAPGVRADRGGARALSVLGARSGMLTRVIVLTAVPGALPPADLARWPPIVGTRP
jgi:hypothetical protein